MKIPIRNLYYLLTYAWDVLDQSRVVDVGAVDIKTPADLFARLLREGVEHLIKRGLDRAYDQTAESIAGIRGKLHVSESLKRLTFLQGKAFCEFDEYSYNVTHNQIIKATLRRLVRTVDLNKELREDLRELSDYFDTVADVTLSNELFRRVQLHSNNRFYLLLLQVCWILHRQLLPTPGGDKLRFVEFTEEQLEDVFEAFIRNYLKKSQSEYQVKVERFPWQESDGSVGALALLPYLETDASLISDTRKLIVEAKFYKKTLTERYRTDTSAIRSGHLYQLIAYLQNLAARDGRPVDGLLLYPRVDVDLLLDYRLLGHSVRVATVDLDVERSEAIGERLRYLTTEPIMPRKDEITA